MSIYTYGAVRLGVGDRPDAEADRRVGLMTIVHRDYAGPADLIAMQHAVARTWTPSQRWHVGDLAVGPQLRPHQEPSWRTRLWEAERRRGGVGLGRAAGRPGPARRPRVRVAGRRRHRVVRVGRGRDATVGHHPRDRIAPGGGAHPRRLHEFGHRPVLPALPDRAGRFAAADRCPGRISHPSGTPRRGRGAGRRSSQRVATEANRRDVRTTY